MVEYVNISAWVLAQTRKQDQLVRKVVLGLDAAVSRRSPVDTGAFKANWMMGIGVQPTGFNENKFDKKPIGVAGDTVATHAALFPRKGTAGHIYYIVNNAPYANALEIGHSTQTNNHRAGIVGLTLVEYDGIVERAMVSVK